MHTRSATVDVETLMLSETAGEKKLFPACGIQAFPERCLGGFVGLRLGSRLSRERFTTYVLVALAALAVMLFVKA